MNDVTCPGCGLSMPHREGLTAHGYYNASPECWSVYTEVLGAEYSNAVLFGQVHQRTVDAYAVQHAGGEHPDKSIDVHLMGLYFVIERGIAPTSVSPLFQRQVGHIHDWPHFTPPAERAAITVFDVALADSPARHAEVVRDWSEAVWRAWAIHHEAIAALASRD